jgi:hypothetical protein
LAQGTPHHGGHRAAPAQPPPARPRHRPNRCSK